MANLKEAYSTTKPPFFNGSNYLLENTNEYLYLSHELIHVDVNPTRLEETDNTKNRMG